MSVSYLVSVHIQHIGSKIFVAVYGESEVAEPICTAPARDLLVSVSCVSVVVQCTNVVFKMTALTTDSVTNTDNT